MSKISVRGGNSGFFKNGVIYGGTPSCIRIQLLRHHKIEPIIDERAHQTFALGFANEAYNKGYFERQGWSFQDDVAVYESIGENVDFQGHADFVVEREGEKFVYELKSISSTRSYEDIIEKGGYKYENLAQLVNYMIAFEITSGVLKYSSFIYHNAGKGKKIAPCSREFMVNIDDTGNIVVDNQPTPLHVMHVLDHRKATAKHLVENKVYPDRPQTMKEGGWDPCGLCSFRDTCDKFDKKELKTTEEFLKDAKDSLQTSDI